MSDKITGADLISWSFSPGAWFKAAIAEANRLAQDPDIEKFEIIEALHELHAAIKLANWQRGNDMLAQNFKSAADLKISEEQKSALIKTLMLLETGKLVRVPMSERWSEGRQFSGQFNMNQWASENDCGTIACIGGTAEIVGNVSFRDSIDRNLTRLFYPDYPSFLPWKDITTAQAAAALRSYLTTGDPRWDLAVAWCSATSPSIDDLLDQLKEKPPCTAPPVNAGLKSKSQIRQMSSALCATSASRCGH